MSAETEVRSQETSENYARSRDVYETTKVRLGKMSEEMGDMTNGEIAEDISERMQEKLVLMLEEMREETAEETGLGCDELSLFVSDLDCEDYVDYEIRQSEHVRFEDADAVEDSGYGMPGGSFVLPEAEGKW